MIKLQVWVSLIASLSITSHSILAQEGSTCTLPNTSAQSTCIRIHYCDSLWTVIKNYGGNPPAEERARIVMHSCGRNVVCCPDNAVATTTTSAPTTMRYQPEINLDAVEKHRNIHLINDKCGSSSINKIINGRAAALGEFPWMVLLQFKSRLGDSLSFNCGGTLISENFVLTAAHCVTRDLVAVRLGEHTISTEKDCNSDGNCADPVQDIQIEKTIKHKGYDGAKKINDIALLKLRTPADRTKNNVKTICLPTEAENQITAIDKQAQDKMLITGWGKTQHGTASDVLMKAFVPFLSNNDCANRFAADKVPIYETYLCAGGRNNTKKYDTCSGDSGGPIQSFGSVNNKPRIILYGVVSVGVKCLDEEVKYPGIYTNVAYYLNWILDNMS